MMEELLALLSSRIASVLADNGITVDEGLVRFEKPKASCHGDYATNVALALAGRLKRPPREIAALIVGALDKEALHLAAIEIAGAGFINVTFDRAYLSTVIPLITRLGSAYGDLKDGLGKSVNIEFVSANPTGYLHIGHGRGASYGDALARVMSKAGYKVTKEFYVNDGGNQIEHLAHSIHERYRELHGFTPELGDDDYHGPEIITIAQGIKDREGDIYLTGDYEEHFKEIGTAFLMEGLKKDLEDFHVTYDVWFHEKTLYATGAVEKTLSLLSSSGATYEKDGATWLKTSEKGDEKDRVLKKSDGSYTYFMPDIAYHMNKLSRGYTDLVDVFGADHHGYIPRLKAAIAFLGGDPAKLDVEILQMVRALKNGEEVTMSKRSGKAITLRDLMDEVGTDALRWFYGSRALSSQMDLDLTLAAKQSSENPVYYVQYAYARIASVFRVAKSQGISTEPVACLSRLDPATYEGLLLLLLRFPAIVATAARERLPHLIATYVYDLATAFHLYYTGNKVITEDVEATRERLTLLASVQIVIKEGLGLLGVNVKEVM